MRMEIGYTAVESVPGSFFGRGAVRCCFREYVSNRCCFFPLLAQKLYYEFALVSFHFFFQTVTKIERGWVLFFVCVFGARTVFYG